MPVDHYENFPVASILLPARLRPAVEAIYAFARSADDIADEGDATPEERLASLRGYEEELNRIERAIEPETPLFRRLAGVIADHSLPLQDFRDLLSAFAQDVQVSRYRSRELLLDYCRRSANPVGRLMLGLYGQVDEANLRDSDDICTALQLINFWQDVEVDARKGRIYLPQEDLAHYGVAEADVMAGRIGAEYREMMKFETGMARQQLTRGAPLTLRLPGRIGLELRMVVQGGLRILEAIESVNFDVYQSRPKLKGGDWLRIGWRAMRMRAAIS